MKKEITLQKIILLFLFSISSLMTLPADSDIYLRKLQGEVIYFVMPDRFENGNRANDYGDYTAKPDSDPADESQVLQHGFKPDSKGYYHGGDIRGIINRLSYLKKMGITAIWITPVFKNNPVQGDGTLQGSSAAHHGYWITDFMQVDPHLGTNDDFKELVNRAHSMGIKVFMDIITNHTADIIGYEGSSTDYISKQTVPYKNAEGTEFDDLDYALSYQQGTPFPPLNLDSFPYKPVVPAGKEQIKNPAWLNNPLYYHNRGNSTFSGENSIYGDFVGLDDLFTAHPEVVKGMIEIYKFWIKEFRVDGFRIDTVKHVNIEFWQQFAPEILSFARSEGIEDFYMFGEVYSGNPEVLSRYTRAGRLPAVLDFGFQGAALSFAGRNSATDRLRDFFLADDYYTDENSSAYNLPTFLGNHDMGRVGGMLARDNRNESEQMLLKRDILAHSLMFTSRGNPTIYYGDEQGFTGVVPVSGGADIHDQVSRQDMFATATAEYAHPEWNNQIGSDATPAEDNFDSSHPLYKKIHSLSRIRKYVPALASGTQIHRYSSPAEGGGIYAFSRILKDENVEYIVALNNNAGSAKSASIPTFMSHAPYMRIYPRPANFWEALKSVRFSNARGEVDITVDSLDMAIYASLLDLPLKEDCPDITLTGPSGLFESGSFWLEAELSYDEFAEVSFYVNEPGKGWVYAGKDDNAPYRVLYDSSTLPLGSTIRVKAVVETYSEEKKSVTSGDIKIENRMPLVTVHYENGNSRERVSGLYSGGQQVYPERLSPEGLKTRWLAGSSELVLMYETQNGDGSFAFDKPVVVSLLENVYPVLEEAGDGTVQATLYINSKREISGTHNFTGTLPDVMPYNPGVLNPAAAPLFIRGGLNGWSTDNELVYQGNYTFSTEAVLSEGDQEFKFADASWGTYNFGAPFGPAGLTSGSNPANLKSAVPLGKPGLYKINFFMFPPVEAGSMPFTYYRFEAVTGPLQTDMYLKIDGPERMQYVGGGHYQIIKTLKTGTYGLTIGDNDTGLDITFAAADAAGSAIVLDKPLEVVRQGSTPLQLTASVEAEYRFVLDVSDRLHPVLTVTALIDHGPYGPIHLRGGSAVSPAGWNADESNILRYSESGKTLSITVDIISTSADNGDWQFKIASADWGLQYTGTSGEWYHPDNRVSPGLPYVLGAGLQTLWIDKVPGRYTFSVDVSDTAKPVLTITRL